MVNIYYEVFQEKLPWDEYKHPLYDAEVINDLQKAAEEAEIPFELITKLIVAINENKYAAKNSKIQKEFDRLINQEWLHYENIKANLQDEN